MPSAAAAADDGARACEPGDGLVIGVAIPVPAPYGEQLTQWRKQFGDPQAANIPPHITLLPPTVISPQALPRVRRHLESVASSERPFDIRLRGTGTFRPVSPVVFVQVAEGLVECERIERSVRTDVLARNLSFYYHPHVTVAHHLDDEALDLAFHTLADYQIMFPVRSFELFEHGADGVWRAVGRFPLDGAQGARSQEATS